MKQEIIEVPLSRLKDDPENPRVSIEEAEEMADSLQAHGQLVPISTYPVGKYYMIQAGHRRKAGFAILQKRTGKEPMVRIIVEDKKLSKEDLLLQKCAMDAQQKNLTVQERDTAWKKLWNVWKRNPRFEKEGKTGFARMLGSTKANVDNFVDRMELGDDFISSLTKKGVGSDVISETKGLDAKTRKKVLDMAAKENIGCREVRQIKTVLKDASDVIVDAVTQRDVTVEQAAKLKSVKMEKQLETIEVMKSMQKDVNNVPSLMKKGQIRTEADKKKHATAHDFVMKLRNEIMDTVNQVASIEGILDFINDEELDKYFSDAGKKELARCLDRLKDRISPAIDRIESQISMWRQ